ncbi:aminopeptidase P family protein [Agrococcus casei]|uniref:Xaa-Pro aminopeptidase n=2 Tax=Agrococcus TaxID=46352 RepID=A0A1R4FX65_9MICO|nr:aminopeptidase P family protein [Agrococcus casei]SJM60519.1 Xaa-Pro aminopeptidase [Agrococcus casei LMG 22410]
MTETTEQEAPRATENRSTVPSEAAFTTYIQEQWADRDEATPEARPAAERAAARRARVSERFAGAAVVVTAGGYKVRSNDTDYPFRAHTNFSYLTGWGTDSVPDSVLVMTPSADGHTSTLFFRERATRTSKEFYANPEIGEFWTGPRPSLDHVAADLAIEVRPLTELSEALAALPSKTLLVGEPDSSVSGALDGSADADGSASLDTFLSEERLVKDAYEIEELRAAVDATQLGFDDMIEQLPAAIAHARGERVLEGTFFRRARMEGNELGYSTIIGAGANACFLHWTRNDGAVREGDLVLIDAGVEVDSLYTADITRTLPISGTFSDVQRKVYDAVLEAADYALSIVKPGIVFRDVHAAAMEVIAKRTAEWGILPVSAEESLAATGQHHRRYMVHGTSHHLGLDVHDCAQARRDMYMDGEVREGMVFTIEPGLYFQTDDLTVPEELRGIGVRIEDDILVTADGAVNLSAGIPRTADEVERWVSKRD